MQEYPNLADWKRLALPSNDKRHEEPQSVKSFECSPSVWTEWVKPKETLATLRIAEDERKSDSIISTAVTGKSKTESDASPALEALGQCAYSLMDLFAYSAL